LYDSIGYVMTTIVYWKNCNIVLYDSIGYSMTTVIVNWRNCNIVLYGSMGYLMTSIVYWKNCNIVLYDSIGYSMTTIVNWRNCNIVLYDDSIGYVMTTIGPRCQVEDKCKDTSNLLGWQKSQPSGWRGVKKQAIWCNDLGLWPSYPREKFAHGSPLDPKPV
jgi:hypothetical protein